MYSTNKSRLNAKKTPEQIEQMLQNCQNYDKDIRETGAIDLQKLICNDDN